MTIQRRILILSLVFAAILLTPNQKVYAAQASCFGPGLWNNHTANGLYLRRGTIGVAHKSLPLGSRINVIYRGRMIRTTVIDRGPYSRNRVFDLTQRLVQKLGIPTCTAWGERNIRTWIPNQ